MTAVGEHRSCPDYQDLTDFIEGSLPRSRVVELTAHLASCAECRLVIESVHEFEAEENGEVSEAPQARSWRWLAVAAVIAGVLFFVPGQSLKRAHQRAAAMSELRKSEAEPKQRAIEPWLSGFDYGEQPRTMRGPLNEEEPSLAQLQIDGAAATVENATEKDHSPEGAHALGIAELLSSQGNKNYAIAKLRAAAKARPNDARIQNDLSAAYYVAGKYSEAFNAANRATQLDPTLTAAWFNAALAIQAARGDAIRAWTEYLKHDPYSEWALEARRRIKELKELPQ